MVIFKKTNVLKNNENAPVVEWLGDGLNFFMNIYNKNMKKIQCNLCGYEIDTHQIKKHIAYCNGLGPKRNRKHIGKGLNWLKGKTHIEIYGEEKAKLISDKLKLSLIGKSTGIASSIEKEEERKRKISISMKGNKNGATSFRKRKIYYNNICFKSGWEILVAKYLDQNNIKWKYENITYSLNETKSYTPDFSIYENEKLIKHIEVKGYWRKENKEKFEIFMNIFPNIIVEIWDKKVLLTNNIMTKWSSGQWHRAATSNKS